MQEVTPQENLITALEAEQYDLVREHLGELHPSEVADLLESQPAKTREKLWDLVDSSQEGDVLSHAQDAVRNSLLEQMHPQEVAEATKDLDADDIADILNDLPEEFADSVLLSMDVQNRDRLASILSYPEDTAGGLMNTDVVPIRADVSLDVVSRYLRRLGELPQQTDSLMIVDKESRFQGVLHLSDILVNKPETTVAEILDTAVEIPADMAASDVAKLFEQRDLLSAAVVDNNGMLLGRITIDDVVDVIQEQAEQTVRSMAGLTDDDMFAPVLTSVKRRAIWLAVNVCTAFLIASVIGQFEATIQQLVALAILMPIVAAMGGISGSQTFTITVRGIATGQIGKSNMRALLIKEIGVGVFNGVIWGIAVATIVALWFNDIQLALIIGVAMLTNLTFAALAGALIPVVLKRLGIDPAIAGGVFLITITDVVGFFTFLGLATIFLIQ